MPERSDGERTRNHPAWGPAVSTATGHPCEFLLTVGLLAAAVTGHLAYFISEHGPFKPGDDGLGMIILYPAQGSTPTAWAGLALVLSSLIGFMTWTGRILGLVGVALYFYRADAILNP